MRSEPLSNSKNERLRTTKSCSCLAYCLLLLVTMRLFLPTLVSRRCKLLAATRARCIQSAAATADTGNDPHRSRAETSPPPPARQHYAIPVRHSRKKLPLICNDAAQLNDLTQEILETPVGSLYTYESGKDSSEDSWIKADPAIQKAEFVIRGHAHTLDGTQWNRWLKNSSAPPSNDPRATLLSIYKIIDRLWDEGHSYMTLREARLDERYGPKEGRLDTDDAGVDLDDLLLEAGEGGDEASGGLKDNYEEIEVFQSVEALRGDMESSTASEEGFGAGGDDSYTIHDQQADNTEDEDEAPSYMDDFALPGPTTHMYDVLLDAMACQATVANEFVTPELALDVVENILGRHELDGGEARNANIHTRPTVLSYNAPIRIAAELPYDLSDKKAHSVRTRDEAIYLAMSCFGELCQSTIWHRNSATYTYLLNVVSKYFPTSRIRGNIAHGMFHHARLQGLIDDELIKSYLAANTPSNGLKFDEFIEDWLSGKPLQELPEKWRRYNRVYRHHHREATY